MLPHPPPLKSTPWSYGAFSDATCENTVLSNDQPLVNHAFLPFQHCQATTLRSNGETYYCATERGGKSDQVAEGLLEVAGVAGSSLDDIVFNGAYLQGIGNSLSIRNHVNNIHSWGCLYCAVVSTAMDHGSNNDAGSFSSTLHGKGHHPARHKICAPCICGVIRS